MLSIPIKKKNHFWKWGSQPPLASTRLRQCVHRNRQSLPDSQKPHSPLPPPTTTTSPPPHYEGPMPRGSSQRCTASGPPASMVSASASEDELALLTGPQLVIHLTKTHRRADFDAVSRILAARDRERASLEANLAAAEAELEAARARLVGVDEVHSNLKAALRELKAQEEKKKALAGAYHRPRDETDEMAFVPGDAAPEAVHRDEGRVKEAKEGEGNDDDDIIDLCSDGEEGDRTAVAGEMEMEGDEDGDDKVPLSQRFKRLRRAEPGELESGKGDGQGQIDSVSTLGNDQQKSSFVKMEEQMTRTGKMACMPEASKVAASVQESVVVKSEKFDDEMPRTVLLPSPGLLSKSPLQKGPSKSDYCKAGTGEKEGSFDGVPATGVSQLLKGDAKMNKTPMVESSDKCGNKVIGAEKCSPLLRPSEERMMSRVGVPFEPCNGNNKYVQVKREAGSLPSTITSEWDSEGHLCSSVCNHVEIAMQALCALYRQRKLAMGDAREESSFSRARTLAEFLLDGDLQGPMRRTVAELENHDATNPLFLIQRSILLLTTTKQWYRNQTVWIRVILIRSSSSLNHGLNPLMKKHRHGGSHVELCFLLGFELLMPGCISFVHHLVKAVLSVIAIYHITLPVLLAEVSKRIDALRHVFIWAGCDKVTKENARLTGNE
ncbi:unnamed protein product [Triticum turgidum subsp. durum]|uniref:Uncharacterized protein n=1 Tax=Triticum turgidum subsp. durum TaxID=4567 RepID=A0A9R0RLR5_TRITD|nr:unnamed protein product [Triticum turgidum subsp. durum]